MADVRVNLAFTADTSKAQAAIQSLQQSLSQLSSASVKGSMSKEMEQASEAAKELQYHLNQAFNAKTGNFDLSRLDKSLKSSGQNIDVLSSKLLGAGQQGQQAFIQLAQSIAAAERPSITLSKRMTDLFTTLKNTAKWQISSSILHGFMGAVQQAYGYAQDLNESLNNIRIVTGYSVDKMAQFAGEANKAAKALSTTTTAYTDASLIYYQQGLSDSEVKERTDVTVKLANVARESATEVSDQMTAVWNNFADGSKSLEYYADVITKLGAATAASNAEIAEGIEKFSAISNTVGLSFEYATSALTTVVDRTRQSADVVGTAFKTMFARIQGLKLGETLEDGTTLNQYSQALQSVGINIKESNGELKDMDVILDEMGAKWKDLNRDEQVALAQKVAGVRQYQQLVSLMENYDFFKENVDLARNSEGALQEQADIYAESWEAASKRVKASAEAIYSDLLNDKFFININNALSGLLDSVDAFIDGFGGIGPLLAGIGSILLGMFAHKIPSALNNLKASFNILFKGAAVQARELANDMKAVSESLLNSDKAEGLSAYNKAALQNTVDLTAAKDRLSAVSAKMTNQEKAMADAELSLIEAQQSEVLILAEKVDKRNESINALIQEFDTEKAIAEADLDFEERELELINAKKEAQRIFLATRNSDNRQSYQQAITDLQQYREHIEETTASFSSYSEALYQAYVNVLRQNEGQVAGVQATIEANEAFEQYIISLQNLESSIQSSNNVPGVISKTGETLQALQEDLQRIIGTDLPKVDDAFDKAFQATSPDGLKRAIQGIIKELKATEIPAEKLEKILVRLGQGANIKKLKSEFKTLSKEMDDLKNKQAQVNKLFGSFDPSHQITGLEKMTAAAAGMGSLAMSISSVKSAIDALGNSDLSFGEKLTTILMSVSMLAGSLRGTLSNLNTALGGFGTIAGQMAVSLSAIPGIMNSIEVSTMLSGAATEVHNKADQEMIANSLAKAAVAKGVISAEQEEAFAKTALLAIKNLDINASKEEIAVALKEIMQSFLSARAKTGETASRMGHVAALYAEAAAAIAANTALSPLLALTLLFVATLAGVALVIVGVVAAFKGLSDAYNADVIAAQKAHETARELSEAYDDCKQHYQDMINTMSEYKEARESLEKLTEGTKEYDEALQKANRAAAELLSNNPGSFTPDDYKFENGQLTINDDALERVQAEGAKKEATMYSASQVANAEAAQADAQALKTSTSRSISKESASSAMYLSEQQVAGVIDKIANENLTTTMSTKELFAEQIGTDPNSAYTQALWENRDALERCAKASLEASNQYDLATQVAVEELLSHNEDVENSDRTEEIKGAAKDKYDKYYQEELDKLDKWGKEGISKANGANDEAKKVFAEYAEAADLKGATLTDTKGSDKNRRFVYLNEEGDEKEVSLEAMQKVVAASRANDKIDNLGTDLATAVEVLDNYMNEIASNKDAAQEEQDTSKLINAIETSLLNGNLDNVAGSDLDNIQGIIDNTEGGIESILGSIFGGEDGKLTDEVAQQYGYDSAQAWIDSFNEQLSNAQVNWKELLAGLPDSIKEMAGSEGASSETLSALNSTYESADRVQEGNGESVMSNINSVVSSVDTGDQTAVLDAMANIDWSDWDAVEQAKQAITELGAATPEAMEKLAGMTDEMRNLNGAAKDLDDLNLSLDADVDEEEYEALAKHLQNVAESSDDLADSLKYDEKEAKKVSEAILRFDKAIEKVDKNYADWSKTLKSGSLQDQAKMATELKDAYADMLDIDIGSLSDDFVMNADNLELMKKAAEGSEEAYNQLQEIARQDIATHVGFDDAEFQQGFSDLMSKYYEGQSLEDLEVGASLNNEGFLQGLTDMVNNAHMTAQQATDYLASMGVDAKVETVKEKAPPAKHEYTGAKAQVKTQEVNSVDPLTGDPVTYKIPSIHYVEDKIETTDTQESTATALKVTSANKSSGGNFKFDNSNHGGGTGGSKKSCFIAGTKVSLGQSFKNIEDIKIGDIVLSYNEAIHKNEYSEVLQTMIHYINEKIYDLYVEDEILSVTGIHRFYVEQNDFIQWIAAENLQVGDNVLFADGTWHKIKDIKVSIQLTTVYNFEVANNHNYYVGKNQILAHNKGGGKKGKGGGSSTPAEKKSLTKKSDVVERYKRIEDRLKVVNKNLDKYNALSDLAYGKEKVKMMDKIIQNYDREIKLQQRLIEEAKQYAVLDKQGLNAAAADLNVKLQYDKDGNIKNIESVQEKIWQKLNALEIEYNNQPTKKAQDEYQKSHIDPFNEKKEEFDKMLGLYESSLDKMNEATQTKLELEIERMSKKLELANYKVKLKIEVRLDDLKRFERELEKLSDTAFTGAKKLAYFTAEITALRSIISNSKSGINNSLKNGLYTTRKTEKGSKEKVTLDDVMTERKLTKDQRKKTYQQILNQEAPTELGYKSWEAFEKEWKFSESLVNDLKEFRNTLLDADDALDEVKEAVDHSLLETFEHWQKVMERNINLAEHYANTSETWLDIIEQIAGRAGMSSGQLKDLRQKDFDTQVNLNKDIWQNYQMASQQYEVSKPAYQKMYDAEIAHENQANARVAELDKLIGNYAGKDYNNKKNNDKSFSKNTGLRATIAKIEDKLENPEKYYKNKNYFSTKEGKEEKERLEEKLKKTKQQVKAYKEEREQYQLLAKESHAAAQQAVDDQAEMLEKVNELKEQGIEGLAALIQAADELLDKELADIMKDFERSISGVYGSIDNMSNAFDQNRQIDERYLRDTEKIYQLNKLNRDLEKSMDETSNVKAKQKLAEFQEKIYKYSAEGVKMSKYDLEVMQKQYDLEVAKIALEEAQNAKTQVRLTRDAEGNYSYTYTADENKTAEAEQTYEDKLNDLIQYNNDYQIETQSAILDAQKSWEDALQDLLSRRKEFTEEEYMAKLQEVNAFYTSQMHYFAGENEKASQHSMEAFVLEYDSYYDNTQKKIGVTKMFTDEEKANYEKMREVYENAAIERDKELYAEEWKYKEQAELINQIYQGKLDKINEFYDKELDALEKSYQAGAVTQEYYLARREQLENEKNDRIKEIDAEKNTDLENAARGHIDVIQGITDQYHEDLKTDIELENGEHKAASDYWQDLMEKDYIANGEYLGKIKDGNTGFITSTQTEFLPGLQDSYTTATESVEGFTNAVTDGAGDKTNNTLMGQINNAVDQNNKNVAAAMGSIGISTSETGETAFEDLADTATTEIGEINSASSDLADEIEADAASGVEDMGIAADGVEDWYNKCYPKWHQAKEDIAAITSALNDLISTAAGADPINVNVKTNFNYPEETEPEKPKKKKTNTTADPPANNPPAEEPTKQKKTSTQGDGKLQVGDKVTLLSQGYEDSWGHGRKISTDYIGQTVKINKYSNKDKVVGGQTANTGEYYISLSTLKGGDLGWVKKKQISGYDTGGYTGKWGADGRLALLHQKELVLNEEDTKNMLSTVSIVRELAAMIDLQAQQARLSSQYALSTGQISSMQNAALDQNVHITAEFPNVQDHNEIEMAITSLVNRASQYAWRN